MTAFSLWDEATRDYEAEVAERRLAHVKVAASHLWSYLSGARSDSEFENRLALSEAGLASAVASVAGPDAALQAALGVQLQDSLRTDWSVISDARHEAAVKEALAREAAASDYNCGTCGKTAVGVYQVGSHGALYAHCADHPPKDTSNITWVHKPKTSAKVAVHLVNVGIEDRSGLVVKGTDPSGNQVKVKVTQKEMDDLASVLYSDLAGNFSGIDVDESDIIKEGYAPSRKLSCGRCGHTWSSRAQYRIACPSCGAEESVRQAARTAVDNYPGTIFENGRWLPKDQPGLDAEKDHYTTANPDGETREGYVWVPYRQDDKKESSVKTAERDCPACDGYGNTDKYPATHVPDDKVCKVCNGTGTVSDKTSARMSGWERVSAGPKAGSRRVTAAAKAIVINFDKSIREQTVSGFQDGQAIVGGLIEPVELSDGSTMWVNEEYLYLPNEQVNWIACDVAGLGGRPEFMFRAPIKGNVYITGPNGSDGEDTDVTDAARNWVKRVAREAGGRYASRTAYAVTCPGCGSVREKAMVPDEDHPGHVKAAPGYSDVCPNCGWPEAPAQGRHEGEGTGTWGHDPQHRAPQPSWLHMLMPGGATAAKTAEARTCSMCDNPAEYYVMGPGSGDWADYYCDEHLDSAVKSLGPGAHVEKVSTLHTAPGGGTHAPYNIEQRGSEWVVVNDLGEVKGHHDSKEEAREQQKALYANVPGASEQAERKSSAKTAGLVTCPACQGSGVFADMLCYLCGGEGALEDSTTTSSLAAVASMTDDDWESAEAHMASALTPEGSSGGWSNDYWGKYQHGDTGQMIYMYRKGQKVRFFDESGQQVGPEQSNVAPAIAWAYDSGYHNPDHPELAPLIRAERGTQSARVADKARFDSDPDYARGWAAGTQDAGRGKFDLQNYGGDSSNSSFSDGYYQGYDAWANPSDAWNPYTTSLRVACRKCHAGRDATGGTCDYCDGQGSLDQTLAMVKAADGWTQGITAEAFKTAGLTVVGYGVWRVLGPNGVPQVVGFESREAAEEYTKGIEGLTVDDKGIDMTPRDEMPKAAVNTDAQGADRYQRTTHPSTPSWVHDPWEQSEEERRRLEEGRADAKSSNPVKNQGESIRDTRKQAAGTSKDQVLNWLRDNYLKKGPEGDALLKCIGDHADFEHFDAVAEHYRGMESGEETSADPGWEFAATALVETHEGPHNPDCPFAPGGKWASAKEAAGGNMFQPQNNPFVTHEPTFSGESGTRVSPHDTGAPTTGQRPLTTRPRKAPGADMPNTPAPGLGDSDEPRANDGIAVGKRAERNALQPPLNEAQKAKIDSIQASVLATNPGLDKQQARRIAVRTVRQYPGVAG